MFGDIERHISEIFLRIQEIEKENVIETIELSTNEDERKIILMVEG